MSLLSLRIKKLHFVGIGGIGMSGIAEVMKAMGYDVTGSDLAKSEITDRLETLGIPIVEGHAEENVRDVDVVVISSAVDQANPEVIAARTRAIPVIRRAEMLGELMRLKFSVGVCGTHGKTTTTSMIGHILAVAGYDPTLIIGGRLISIETNAQLGESDYLVAEADEYDRSFLELFPSLAVATNLEPEHLDCYRDFRDLSDSFAAFLNRVPFYGTVIYNADDPGLRAVIPDVKRPLLPWGFTEHARVRGRNRSHRPKGGSFEFTIDEENLGRIELNIPGAHNLENALAAAACAWDMQVPVEIIQQALASFTGVGRRFEVKGVASGVTVVDDYAHHPTEVAAALATGKAYASGRLIIVFQPHLYSRTRFFYRQFAEALAEADEVILAAIYPSREAPIPGIDSGLILDVLKRLPGVKAWYEPEFQRIPQLVAERARSEDVVMTIGAGSIYRLGPLILEAIGKRQPAANMHGEVQS
jgi:UDP-N-acetylmuramate--alanine ligase